MPKRTDIKSVLIIGAGPIIIGQACEFDYSGVQACKALREEGYKVILINSNPATIMTDPATADVTYIEPITWQTVEKIIAQERPHASLPTSRGLPPRRTRPGAGRRLWAPPPRSAPASLWAAPAAARPTTPRSSRPSASAAWKPRPPTSC